MASIALTNGKTFEAPSGMTILEGALSSNVTMIHSCRTGRCGACKCKLVSGSAPVVRPETSLSQAEQAEGWILTCARTAESDLVLDEANLLHESLPVARTLPCKISNLKMLTRDVMQIQLRLPPTANFNFIPGQFVDIIGPQGIRRSYSLANAPNSSNLLELHIKSVPNGIMSEYWFQQAKINDLLRLSGPHGTFFWRKENASHLILIATGTGIAPLKAMLDERLEISTASQQNSPVTLIWGARTKADLYLDPPKINDQFKFIPVLSRADTDWCGERGHVQDAVMKEEIDLNQAAAYVCGSPQMVESVRNLLIQKKLPQNQFFSESFVSSATL